MELETSATNDRRAGWRVRFVQLKESGVWVRYPWPMWFNGQEWLLEQGKDFDLSPKSFQTKVSLAAKRHGVRVESHRSTEGVFVKKTGRRD